jgi:hypothetical protein
MAGIRNAFKNSVREHDEMTNYFGILGVRRNYNIKGKFSQCYVILWTELTF